METITYQQAQDLLKQANDKLSVAAPKFANVRGIEILDSGITCFNPKVSWLGTCGNSPETAVEFANALMLAAELVDAMPHKGAQVTF